MRTAWAHLPNAKHIDRVLASLNVHSEIWAAVERPTPEDEWLAARSTSMYVSLDANRGEVWLECMDSLRLPGPFGGMARLAARDVILALVAWDDCTYLLDSDPDEVALLAKLGDHKAILILPACIVFTQEKGLACNSKNIN